MKKVKLFLGYSGYCYAKEKFIVRNGGHSKIKCYALFGLIQHPQKGWILFDTGYSTDFYEYTKKFPQTIYAKATNVVVKPEDQVLAKLHKMGIKSSEIRHIIITHFHADHIGGLKDFEQATIYCSKKAYDQVKDIKGYWSFSKGILKPLLPPDTESRLKYIEEVSTVEQDDIFGKKYDLFNDRSILLIPLPGHAAGQIGAILQTQEKKYFFVADACWVKEAYERIALPSRMVSIFIDSWRELCDTIYKIHLFHKQYTGVMIVPTHCIATTSRLIKNTEQLNEV